MALLGALSLAGCGTPSSAIDDRYVDVERLLPVSGDIPGSEVGRLDNDGETVLSLNIHTPETGVGDDSPRVFEPEFCEAESDYADNARIRLIPKGAASVVDVRSRGGGVYVVLVSATDTDVERAAQAHTGKCSNYHVSSSRIRTERLPLPSDLAKEDAVILSEVSDPDNPKWSNTVALMGYASVNNYSVVLVAYEDDSGATRSEFADVMMRAVEKVRRVSGGEPTS